jgi:Zn-finger nucleic acid-binding protein
MTDKQGIEIDYCPECRGVWLDRGELDKLVARAEPPADARPRSDSPERTREPERHYRDDPYRGKPRKSFLHELFD